MIRYSGEQFTAEQLSGMTIAHIKSLAAERDYTITKSLKADIVAEFMEQEDSA